MHAYEPRGYIQDRLYKANEAAQNIAGGETHQGEDQAEDGEDDQDAPEDALLESTGGFFFLCPGCLLLGLFCPQLFKSDRFAFHDQFSGSAVGTGQDPVLGIRFHGTVTVPAAQADGPDGMATPKGSAAVFAEFGFGWIWASAVRTVHFAAPLEFPPPQVVYRL